MTKFVRIGRSTVGRVLMVWIVVSVALAIVGGYLGFSRPRWGWLLLVIAAVMVEIIHAFYPRIEQYIPFVGVGIGVFARSLAQWRTWWPRVFTRRRLYLWFLLYLLVIAVATVVAIDPRVSLRYAVGVPAVLWITTLYFPFLAHEGAMTIRKLAQSWAIIGSVLAVSAGIGAVVFHSGFPVPVGHRVILAWQWPFANKNTLGMMMTFAVPAAFGLIFHPRQMSSARRGVSIALFVLTVLGDALSYSRSGWIAAAIGVGVFVMAFFGRKGFIGMLIGVPLAFVALVLKTGIHRWELLWHKGLNGRTVLWRAGFRALQHHWWFGVGPGNSPQAILPYVPSVYAGVTPQDSILRTAVEIGLVGLTIWLVIVVGGVLRLARQFWLNRRSATSRWEITMVGSLLLATLAQQMVESLFLGGVSFGDFFFTILISWVWMMEFQGRHARLGSD